MPSERTRVRLEDIRQNIALIRSFIAGMGFDDFAADAKTIYAVTRALEIVSEASRHLEEDVRARHSHIDWIAIRDAGNVYRHGYELVTERRLWDTITKHLPVLESAVAEEFKA